MQARYNFFGRERLSRRQAAVLSALALVTIAAAISLAPSTKADQNDDTTQAPEKPKMSKEEKRRQKALRQEMETPYKKWLSEEVPYIITDEERAAFKKLLDGR